MTKALRIPRVVAAFLLLLTVLPAAAAIWPDQLFTYTRTNAARLAVTDAALWEEYGFQEAESATYEDAEAKVKFQASAYRLADPTGAYAAFQWQRPAGAAPSKISELSVETADAALIAFGNYLMRFEGYKPKAEEVRNIVGQFPRLQTSSLPALEGYLPKNNRRPASERYILGPVSLERFEPRIPASVAGFHLGTEGQYVRYADGSGEFNLTLLSYPTPNLAKQQLLELQAIDGALVKRSGPLVAVLFGPAGSEYAQGLLSAIRYQAEISWNEHIPTQKDNIGDLVVNAFILIGLLLGFFILSGAAFGGLRLLRRRIFKGQAADDPIFLHIEDR